MADTSAVAAGAAHTAEAVATQAASGNVWAFGVFVVVVVGALAGLWIWRHTDPKAKAPDGDKPTPPPSCTPSDGCPSIQVLVARFDALVKEVEGLTKELEDDRQERREHRDEVKETVNRLHERIDMIHLFGSKARTA